MLIVNKENVSMKPSTNLRLVEMEISKLETRLERIEFCAKALLTVMKDGESPRFITIQGAIDQLKEALELK